MTLMAPHTPSGEASLSAREIEVALGLMCGQQTKTIARALGVAENTVKGHLTEIYKKLGARNRPHAAYILLGGHR